MKCGKCGSSNLQLETKEFMIDKKKSPVGYLFDAFYPIFMWGLIIFSFIFFSILTAIIIAAILIFCKQLGKKEKVLRTVAICKDCGNNWVIENNNSTENGKNS